jgi:hypothetical protein
MEQVSRRRKMLETLGFCHHIKDLRNAILRVCPEIELFLVTVTKILPPNVILGLGRLKTKGFTY